MYLQTCCCIIKNDVEKFFRTDDVEDFEDFQKKRTELTDESDESYRRTANRKQDFSFKMVQKEIGFSYIAIAGVIAAVITAAFTGYYLHQERAEEKKQEEIIKSREGKKAERKKAKTTEIAEQKLERVRSQAEEQGVPQSVIELLDKNAETVDFVADYEKKRTSLMHIR